MDKLKAYKVDKGYSEGVEITLDRAEGVVCLVKLPGPYNRPYMAAIYGNVRINVGADGEATGEIQAFEARDNQERAFVEHCLLTIDNQPVPVDFIEEYPEALSELMGKASLMVEEIANRVEEGSKKSVPSLIGNTAGATG